MLLLNFEIKKLNKDFILSFMTLLSIVLLS